MKRPLSGEGLMATGFGELKVFSGSAHPQLAREIAEFLGIPLGQARLRRFPDSEVSFQIDENIRGADVFIVQPTSNPVDQHLMELLVMIDAFRRSSAARITAVVPYYGYARQDRKDKPRVPISAKLVANLLSAAGTNRVLTMDLHKAQIQGFFDIPVDHLFAAPVIIEYCSRLQLSEPDDRVAGCRRRRARARVRQAARCRARRRGQAAHRGRHGGSDERDRRREGRTCILQDDIIDTAGTIQKAARRSRTRAPNGAGVRGARRAVGAGDRSDREVAARSADRDQHDPASAARRSSARRSSCCRWPGCSARRSGISTKRHRFLRCSCRGGRSR